MTTLPIAPQYEEMLQEMKKQTQLLVDQRSAQVFAAEASQKKAKEYERLRVVNAHLEAQQQEILTIESKRAAVLAELLVKVETLIEQNFSLITLVGDTAGSQRRACEVMAEGFRAIAQTLAIDHKVASKDLLDFIRAVSPAKGDVSITNLTTGGDIKAGNDFSIKQKE